MSKYSKSLEYLSRAEKLIPVQSQTFSKSPQYFVKGVSPVYLEKGNGAHVIDVDGNEYLDYILGLGVITLGYNYPIVNEAIENQLRDGIIFSLPHPLEIELSELLTEIIPCAEMVRFSKTGSEVTSAAIKAARAYTGRDHIAFRGYHGWHDWYSIVTEKNKGIPESYSEYMHEFKYNDLSSLEWIFNRYPDDIATVIMEPMIVEEPRNDFLNGVKDLAHRNGALLIFDEIVTGFRWSLGGAQEYFSVIPDLATFGKGISNGMPLSAIVGKKEIMQEFEEVFFSTTFGGECLSLAAGLATIEEMMKGNMISHIWKLGKRLKDGLNSIGLRCIGFPCRPMIELSYDSPILRSLYLQELIKKGILIHSGMLINLCYSHTKGDIDKTLNAFAEIKQDIDRGKIRLEGEMVKPAFRRL